jgi:DNA-binding XRE family transcriptional regulator
LTICEIQLIAKKPNPRGYNINSITLGDYLKLYRIENGYTRFELALELEVYKSTIYKWENNYIKPQGKNLNKIIEFMGYDPRIHKSLKTKYYELT